MRNTSDLSTCLSVIRKITIERRSFDPNFVTSLYPIQTLGHYIHGPRVTIHVLENFDKELLHTIFAKELDTLCSEDFKTNDLGIINNGIKDALPSMKDLLELRRLTFASVNDIIDEVLESKGIPRGQLWKPYSMEWPAVIAFQTLSESGVIVRKETYQNCSRENYYDYSSDYETLYVLMSRARVKCTVILIPIEGFSFDSYSLWHKYCRGH